MKKAVLLLVCLGILVPGVWILILKFEGTAPEVTIELPSQYLKKSYVMALDVQDHQTGIRQVQVSLMQKGNEKVVLDKTYSQGSILNTMSEKHQDQASFQIPIEIQKYGYNDGEAVIRVMVTDGSWRGWNRGNRFYKEKKVIIDSQPPKLQILTRQHNIQRGGAALVIYREFEPDIVSGVMVGDHYFPGHSSMFKDPMVKTAFFALDHTQGPGTRIFVRAKDLAGNVTDRGFHHYIRDKNFRHDVLNISDRFLERKIPKIDIGDKETDFSGAANPLLEKFLYVNGTLRKQNVDTVLAVPSDTVEKMLWKGRFGRLAGSANRARFGDRRVYKHEGNEIDRAVHLGVDLASTANAPVGAANAGRVIMTRNVGIFGNTIILDHGFGLASLYCHLSEVRVNEGDTVAKKDVIGLTGLTGLAGGDHLHLSVIVHDVFVNPVEWWDANWIKNNITSKIAAVQKQISASGN
jgi:hypothetical protein